MAPVRNKLPQVFPIRESWAKLETSIANNLQEQKGSAGLLLQNLGKGGDLQGQGSGSGDMKRKPYLVLIPDWGGEADWRSYHKKRDAIKEASKMAPKYPKGALVVWEWSFEILGIHVALSREVFRVKGQG
ncbi:hypothetical protein IIC45_01260 [Patescibacteria group bacterium]|nr:hypothetical protein [Patescibacteria group bacterium]